MQVTTEHEPGTDSASAKPNGKANGKANGKNGAVLPFPPRTDEAAQEAAAPDAYEPPEPEPKQLELAEDIFRKLENDAREMGIQDVINALISIVDVHPRMCTPELFGGSSDEADKWEPADVVTLIARFLCRASSKLEVNPSRLVFYFKDHEKWTSHGQKVHGKVTRFSKFTQHHLEGMLGAIQINFHLWKTLNPRQKVFDTYHLLREIDAEGGTRAPDWSGYFEEPGLFGSGVHEEMVTITKAFVRDAKEHVDDPHQLSILAGIYD